MVFSMGKDTRMQDILTVLREAPGAVRFTDIQKRIDEKHGKPNISPKTLSKYLHILESRGYVRWYSVRLRRGEGREYELTPAAQNHALGAGDQVNMLVDRIHTEEIDGELLELLQARELLVQVHALVDMLLVHLVEQDEPGGADTTTRSVLNAQIENIFKLAKTKMSKEVAADIAPLYDPRNMDVDIRGIERRISELEDKHIQDRIREKGIDQAHRENRQTLQRYFPDTPRNLLEAQRRSRNLSK